MLNLYHLLGNKQGDVYYVESESAGYVWIDDNGTLRWEILGMTVDTSNFLTKSGLLQTSGTSTNNTMSQNAITSELGNKQPNLVSGTNIKTINNESILGSGNIEIEASGDIEEIGSNTNGSYIKYKNGILICYGTFSKSIANSNYVNWGSIKTYNMTNVHTFPISFISKPICIVQTVSNSATNWVTWSDTSSTQITGMGVTRPDAPGNATVSYKYYAIGTWK